MVKQLREMTDSPMMDCKKALVEADGDMDAAVDVLRKNGLAKACLLYTSCWSRVIVAPRAKPIWCCSMSLTMSW